VADAGDQAGQLPNDPHAFTYTPAGGSGTEGSGFVVPGAFAGKWFKSYKEELDAFEAATAMYHGPYCPELLDETIAFKAGYTDCDVDGVAIAERAAPDGGLKAIWEDYNEWAAEQAALDPWNAFWAWLGVGAKSDPGIPAWPPAPPALTDMPVVGGGANDL